MYFCHAMLTQLDDENSHSDHIYIFFSSGSLRIVMKNFSKKKKKIGSVLQKLQAYYEGPAQMVKF